MSIFRVEDLKVEIEGSSETSVSVHQTALPHVTGDRGLHIRRIRNPKSYCHIFVCFTSIFWTRG